MIDSPASRILALPAARPSHRVPRISIRSLQLIQAFGPAQSAALRAGSELVVLIFEQEVGTRGQISTLKGLTHSLPLASASRLAHLRRSRPCGSIREQAI